MQCALITCLFLIVVVYIMDNNVYRIANLWIVGIHLNKAVVVFDDVNTNFMITILLVLSRIRR